MAQPTSSEELRNKPPPADIDPNVILPKAVAEAGKRSDIIQASLATGGPPTNGAAPNGELQEPGNDEVQIQTPQEIAPQEQENLSPEDWQRRYNAMRGRVEQQTDQMRQMAEQLQRLQVRNNSSAPAPQRNDAPRKLLTDQEIEDYGPEFVDVVRRAAAEVATPLVRRGPAPA